MIKDTIAANEGVLPNSREIEVLKEHFPACFNSDGIFDIERFKEYLSDNVSVTNEGYELRFLGKNYARLLASLDTTTVIVPNEEHNSKPENEHSRNVYISGDNLDGLKHLLKSYAKGVKCIYIDPPYNTGSDGFVYNDSYNFTAEELSDKLSISEEHAKRILDLTKRGSASHSAWLMVMYPRLLLARELLDDDGIVFISIDSNEEFNLKLICDDIFGEENFLTCISRATGTPTGGGFDGFANETDYILVYSRRISNAIIRGLEMTADDASIYNEVDSNGHRYLTRTLRRTGGEDRREDRPTMFYPLIAPDGTNVYPYGPTGYESRWRCSLSKAKKMEDDGLIEWKQIEKDGRLVWHPYKKFYLNESKKPGNIWKGIFEDEEFDLDLWDDIEGNKKATRDVKDLFDGKKVFETAKPIEMIERIISIASEHSDLVVDFFGGSSTTAHAVMNLNVKKKASRQFIIIQLKEPVKPQSEAAKAGFATIDQIGTERIIRAAKKIREENPDTTADLGFRHFTLADPSGATLDKLEQFSQDDNGLVISNTVLEDFGIATVLTTWLVHDGYGFTAPVETMNFAGYTGYYMDKHLYLIAQNLSNDAIAAITDKLETDGAFNPENVVLFGYSFTWTEVESLKTNLARLKDTEKNLRINFDIRY